MKTLTTLLLSASLALSIQIASASTASKTYSLTGEARSGSLIPPVAATSNVPFNKRYEDLTLSQQELVKAKFDQLADNARPPFPARGLADVYKPLIKANKIYGDNQPLSVRLNVNSKGKVDRVTVNQASGTPANPELVAYLDKKLRRTAFEPAYCGDSSCSMDFPIEISFN